MIVVESRAMAARQATLADVAIANLRPQYGTGRLATLKAMKKAADAIAVAACLAIAAEKGAGRDGDWPTQAEYAAWWKMTDRHAQREWQLFRRAFPGEEGPERLAKWLLTEYGRRLAEGDQGNPSVALTAPATLFAVAA